MPGPPKKPTRIKILEGVPGGKHKLQKKEPKPKAPNSLSPPAHLDGIASALWRRLVVDMVSIGLLTESDRVGLESYCTHYSLWRQALALLQKNGLIHETPNGHKQPSPYDTMVRHHAMMVHKLGVEFGFTPASRARISVPEQGGDDAKEKAMFG